jgi:hypothetical protein
VIYDYHQVVGLIAVGVGIVGYIPYYRNIFLGKTKPHPFTWLGFSLVNGIAFFAQILTGGGPGAWVSFITALATLGIAILAFNRGEKKIIFFDWVCFVGALVGIISWKLTNNPLSAVVIVTIANFLALAPTFRKAFLRPHEETASLYLMSALKFIFSLFALTSFTLTTALFPSALILCNIGVVILLVIRRRCNTENH